MTQVAHIPVMLSEVMATLDIKPGRWYIDATFGAGGHSQALLAAGANVFALDQDMAAKDYADQLTINPSSQFVLRIGNFKDIDKLAAEASVTDIMGVLMDLGLSSMQIDEGARGFAFRQDGPLDMRMSQTGQSAADLVNNLSQEDLAAIIYRFGEERYSRRIARAITEKRSQGSISTTQELANIIQQAYPGGPRRDHPARRTFQALRIAVNDELGVLETALNRATDILETGGRLVLISYHSLEDRIVKHFMKAHPQLKPLFKKPQTASMAEIEMNPRSRSAKLRAAIKGEA